MNHDVLIVHPINFLGAVKKMLRVRLQESGISDQRCYYLQATRGCTTTTGTGASKKTTLIPSKIPSIFNRLIPFANYKIIICIDPLFLSAISDGRYQSLYQCRGSVYELEDPATKTTLPPVIVFDDIRKTRYDKHAPLVYSFDINKARRWITGKQYQHPPLNYTLVANIESILDFVRDGQQAKYMALDVETSGAGPTAQMTVTGYAFLMPDWTIKAYVIPFVAPWNEPSANFWTDEELETVIQAIQTVHATPTPKAMQNGAYDCSYYAKYHLPVRNFCFDTAVAAHSIWVSQPKRLDFLASLYCDFYAYWKDERADSAADDSEKSDVKVPQTKQGFIQYCRYNATDCYYTLLVSLMIGYGLSQPKSEWAKDNFLRHMRAWVGPSFRMAMTGVAVDREIQAAFSEQWLSSHDKNLADLRLMTNSPDFNPNSPAQVASFLYDFLRTTPIPRKGKSTDEKVLQLVSTQGVIEKIFINQIGKTKKPANNNSKYGLDPATGYSNLFLLKDRWLYSMNAIGTKMERYASKKHHFWCGTNMQNVPYEVRNMVKSDPGMVLLDADYSASDGWFTAYSSNLNKMIDIMHDERDTHCVHAAQFFQKSYDEIYNGYKAGDGWVVDSIGGVRQNTKRIVYGSNYLMAGYTMLLTMGPEAVIASAIQLGHADAQTWNWKQLTEFCQLLIDFYFNEMYPGLQEWLDKMMQEIAMNGGIGTAIGGFTRKFFGDILHDNEIQREIASFYGQSGTARNINNAIDTLYYDTDFYKLGGRILFQVHDSIVAEVPEKHLHECAPILKSSMLNESIAPSGRKFTVPVSIDCGYGWGKKMMIGYTPELTIETLRATYEKTRTSLLENG